MALHQGDNEEQSEVASTIKKRCPICNNGVFQDEESDFCLCGWRPGAGRMEAVREPRETKVISKPSNFGNMIIDRKV